jgi:hypothetical protein
MEKEPDKAQSTKEREYVDGVEVGIQSVDIDTAYKDPNQVAKVTFKTDKGDITYKPKINRTEFREGLKINKKEPCLIDDLPDKVKQIAKKTQEVGIVTVLVSYQVWNTTVDGEKKTYRYIQSSKTLDKWQIIEEKPPKTERVV